MLWMPLPVRLQFISMAIHDSYNSCRVDFNNKGVVFLCEMEAIASTDLSANTGLTDVQMLAVAPCFLYSIIPLN